MLRLFHSPDIEKMKNQWYKSNDIQGFVAKLKGEYGIAHHQAHSYDNEQIMIIFGQ